MTCFKKAARGEFLGYSSHLLKLNWNTSQSDLPFSQAGRQLLVAAVIHAHFRTEQPFTFSDSRPASSCFRNLPRLATESRSDSPSLF